MNFDMTIELFKTKPEVEEELRYIKRILPWCKDRIIKIKYNKYDGPQFGMRGFSFNAQHGKTYYIIAPSKTEVKSWGLYSKIL